MTSLFSTMFVLPAPPVFPHAAKALEPISTFNESTCTVRNSDLECGLDSTTPPSPGDAQWSWGLGSLLASSPVQSLFGSRKRTRDEETQHTGYAYFSASQTRGSMESLRSSLDLPSRPSPPRKAPLAHREQNRTDTENCVDTLNWNRNARSSTKGSFKPQKTSRGNSTWQLRQFAEATLGSGSLKKAVKLPDGEDLNEWLAVNVVDFYNQINLLYGSITEFCSPKECPEMKATDEFEYLWQDADSQNFKKPTKMSAPEYVEHLMAWCQSSIDNEQLFPTKMGVAFPKTFQPLVRQMFKRLYRVYAHIYCHHYPMIVHLQLDPHLNTSFKHYVLFIQEHQLATGKDFWGPLGDLVESMLKTADT